MHTFCCLLESQTECIRFAACLSLAAPPQCKASTNIYLYRTTTPTIELESILIHCVIIAEPLYQLHLLLRIISYHGRERFPALTYNILLFKPNVCAVFFLKSGQKTAGDMYLLVKLMFGICCMYLFFIISDYPFNL